METLIVYFSKFGNTHKIANAIADAIPQQANVTTIDFEHLTHDQLVNIDLLVIGSPTHNMNLPKTVKPIFEEFPKRTLPGTPVAAFDTSYEMSWMLNQFTASKHLARKLRKLGGKLLLPPEIFLVTGREGPLVDGELQRAKNWAESLWAKLDNEFSNGIAD
jgi:flavodoxin